MDRSAVAALARALMDAHGLGEWTFRFDRATRRAGSTRPCDRTLTLSGPLSDLYDEAQVRDVILHEIAHARVGTKHHHDAVWQAEARRLGARPSAHVSADAPRVSGPWVGTCPSGHTIDRMRAPRRVLTCARCSPTFDLANVFTWAYRGVERSPGRAYAAHLGSCRRRVGPGRRDRGPKT